MAKSVEATTHEDTQYQQLHQCTVNNLNIVILFMPLKYHYLLTYLPCGCNFNNAPYLGWHQAWARELNDTSPPPTVKHTGQESEDGLCEIFGF